MEINIISEEDLALLYFAHESELHISIYTHTYFIW